MYLVCILNAQIEGDAGGDDGSPWKSSGNEQNEGVFGMKLQVVALRRIENANGNFP